MHWKHSVDIERRVFVRRKQQSAKASTPRSARVSLATKTKDHTLIARLSMEPLNRGHHYGSSNDRILPKEDDYWFPMHCKCCPLWQDHRHPRTEHQPRDRYPPSRKSSLVMAGDGLSTPYRTPSQQSTRSPYQTFPTYHSNGHVSYVDEIGDRLGSPSPSHRHDEIRQRTPSGQNTQLLVPPNLDVLHQARKISNTMGFKAAAGRLYSTLYRAEKFFDVFLRSFKDEISQQYMNYSKERLWQDKVMQYNQDLLVPSITGSEDTNNDYTYDDPTNRPQENESFKELQFQLGQQIVALCMSKIVPPKRTPEHQTAEANQQSPVPDIDLQFSSDDAVRLQVAYDMAKPLLQHVQTVHSRLISNISRMHTDWRAACETLVMIKRLRGLMHEYRRAWKPLSNLESDERY